MFLEEVEFTPTQFNGRHLQQLFVYLKTVWNHKAKKDIDWTYAKIQRHSHNYIPDWCL
jgi:hypothetical protein